MPLDQGLPAYTDMGPTLLAAQPPSLAAGKDPTAPAWWPEAFAHGEQRILAMRTWRWSWWRIWGTLAAFFMPRRYVWLVTPNRQNRGNPRNDQIIDSGPLQAVRTCASGLWTGLTSPSRKWFKLGIGLPWVELEEDAKAWLEQCTMRIYTVFNQSNIYTTLAQMFKDVTVFGTSPMILYEDDEDVIRAYLPCAGEYFLAAGARLTVDTFAREFTYTVAQIVEFATLEMCPLEVRQLWKEGNTETELVVAHLIEPNFPLASRSTGRKTIEIVPRRFTYREMYWLRSNKTASGPLVVRGFNEKPFMTARWALESNDPYGASSPCLDALGDNKQIQLEQLRKAEFIEKGVRPPMGADPELKNEPASIIPGMITFVNTGGQRKGFWPLFEPNPVWLSGITADIKDVNERVNRCLFVDVFMAISRMEGVQPRNELELTKRDLERLQVLGPVVELFENEFASPMIERVMRILERRGMLPPMPPSLQGVPLKVEYTSIMRMAQLAAKAVGLKDFMQTMGGMSSAAKAAGVPDPLRVVNLEAAAREYADATDVGQKILYTPKQVQQHDNARAEEVAKAQQDAKAPMAADATTQAVQAAKTLSETQLNNGSALDAIAGAGSFRGA